MNIVYVIRGIRKKQKESLIILTNISTSKYEITTNNICEFYFGKIADICIVLHHAPFFLSNWTSCL